jgi:hypothetical protein
MSLKTHRQERDFLPLRYSNSFLGSGLGVVGLAIPWG